MDATPVSQQDLINRLLLLNKPENPFKVEQVENGVKASWNLVDAKWLQILGVAGLKEYYEITLTLNESNYEVSYNERMGTISWSAGIPSISFSASAYSGKTKSFQKSVAFGVKPNLEVGKIYDIDFSTSKIKDPLLQTVESSGWKIKRSFIEKLMGL